MIREFFKNSIPLKLEQVKPITLLHLKKRHSQNFQCRKFLVFDSPITNKTYQTSTLV